MSEKPKWPGDLLAPGVRRELFENLSDRIYTQHVGEDIPRRPPTLRQRLSRWIEVKRYRLGSWIAGGFDE